MYHSFNMCCFKWGSEEVLASALVAMQPLELYLRCSALLLKVEISFNFLKHVFVQPGIRGTLESLSETKCCVERTATNIENNELKSLCGLCIFSAHPRQGLSTEHVK